MKLQSLIFCLSVFDFALGQSDSVGAVQQSVSFQKELNSDYKDEGKSPLEPHARRRFKGHSFYPIDLRYRVVAKLAFMENSPFAPMKTTTSRLPNYRVFALAKFTIAGRQFVLPIYQSQDLLKKPEYSDYLFLPFTDLTNDKETYVGGRYIGLRIPKGDELVIDFNQAYNPYCAYNHKFSCPIVPPENHLDMEVRAGIKLTNKH